MVLWEISGMRVGAVGNIRYEGWCCGKSPKIWGLIALATAGKGFCGIRVIATGGRKRGVGWMLVKTDAPCQREGAGS